MTVRLSSGMCDAIISNWGLGSMLVGGHIQIWSGQQPASANNPPTGTLLGRITNEGYPVSDGAEIAGLAFMMGAAPGEIVNAGNWVLKGEEAGTPGWWRFVRDVPDDGSPSMVLARVDGAIEDGFTEFPETITPGTQETLLGYKLSIPHER